MAEYRFLPWVRAGLAAQLPAADEPGADLRGRARLRVDVEVSRRAGDAVAVQRTLEVAAPGDVTGIDRRQVIRTDPAPGATDFEPNLLAIVEFDRPDFPWLFTPARAGARERLRPWIVLVVVEIAEGVSVAADAGRPLPVLTIAAAAQPSRQLPDLGDSWAWAHGQVFADPGERVDDLLGAAPERTASRLVCPRRLEPMTRYLACVVPAFMGGRLAGLGEPPEPEDDASLRPAWTAGSDEGVQLPVYFSWEFATGAGGDFESLARALRARPVPPEVGRTAVEFGGAGPPLPAPDAEGLVVGLRGALVGPEDAPSPWPAATRAAVEQGLREVLDLPARRLGAGAAAVEGPAVAPPLYGSWLAGRRTVPAGGEAPPWLRTLNVDPRHRAVAGMATKIVQAEQERLMDQAWAQVGEIERANRELRWAQLAVQVRASLLRRHVEPLPPGRLLDVTVATRRRLLVGDATLDARARASAVPEAALTPAFRRAARPRGPLARRLHAPGGRTVRPLIEGLDGGTLTPAAPDRAPDGLFGFASTAPARPGVPAETVAQVAAAAQAGATKRPGFTTADRVRSVAVTDSVAVGVVAKILSKRATIGGDVVPRPPTVKDRALANAFKTVLTSALESIDRVATPQAEPPRPALGVDGLRSAVLEQLDPARAVHERVLRRIRIPEPLRPVAPRDPLDDVLAAPTFPQPAWELLRDHFPEHLLPGLEHVPPNTATAVKTNPAFAEALLVGLNHELARELLWREFPTDQRGTGFRRFWAPGGRDDVEPIHRWAEQADLGDSLAGGPDGQLVLLVRGDLLRRYPSTVIYAAPDANGRPLLEDAAVKVPLFRGRVE
ncbi:MAG TPA: hypothetical protein VHF89_09660, partial [Solirubrobacteraceae bacterium]|nr:hypothetical protein [Solirubrobacteraceae bacterium]